MTDIVAAHGITRSGRCYAPEEVNRGNLRMEQNKRRNIIDDVAAEFWRMILVKEYFIED